MWGGEVDEKRRTMRKGEEWGGDGKGQVYGERIIRRGRLGEVGK